MYFYLNPVFVKNHGCPPIAVFLYPGRFSLCASSYLPFSALSSSPFPTPFSPPPTSSLPSSPPFSAIISHISNLPVLTAFCL